MIHAPNIVHETLEGETIVIHLETGNYYSLTGSGAEIWALLKSGGQVSGICAELARRHGCPETEVRGAAEEFVDELAREGLVKESDASPDGLPTGAGGAGGPWKPPKIERFGDMRDFLLVDPIHDVDTTGWPSRKPSEAEAP